MQGFPWNRAKGNKILMKSRLSDEFSHIRKGKMLTLVDSVTTLGREINVVGINPGNGCRHHTKIEMINDGMRIPVLALGTADVLFDFFETGFNFPSRAIELYDLLDGQIEVGAKERDPA